MSDLLQIGASGVRAYGTALATVGENVSNANTAGYTRRTISTQENAAGGSLYYNGAPSLGGVRIAGIGRAWNDYQAAALRTAAGDAGRASARATWLANTETALSDDETGVGQSATAVFTAGDTLAAAPGNRGNRQAFLAAIDQAASAFRTTAGALKDVSDGIAAAADTGIATVNSSLDALDKVNAAIRAGQPGTAAQASLLDQRDAILDSVAGAVGIDVAVGQDGTATVKLASNGLALVSGSGGAGARLAASRASDGRLSLQAIVGGATQPIADAGGTLGGLAESSATVGDRRQSLDTLAENFKSALNAWSAQGTDANGAAGGALLVGTGASGLTSATTDPDAVPAANGSSANGNLLALSALRTSTGAEAKWNAMVSDQGQKVAAAKAESSAATARSDAATTARNDDSGVDLDSEAAELVRYQQAYNASAKVIQTARETMQAILDII